MTLFPGLNTIVNKNILPLVLVCLTFPGMGGCNSVFGPRSNPAGLRTATRPNSFDTITKGMSAAEVRALVGKPHGIKADKADGTEAEIWLYQQILDKVVRQVHMSTRDVPAVNPITGQSIIIQEPVMSDEVTTLYQDIELQMADDHVMEISRRQRVERKIR